MDFSAIEVWILRGATTVLLTVAVLQLLLREVMSLWTEVKRAKDIIVETKGGPVRISVNPESEESVRELLDVVAKAETTNDSDIPGRQQ
jgi:hypothetical protein